MYEKIFYPMFLGGFLSAYIIKAYYLYESILRTIFDVSFMILFLLLFYIITVKAFKWYDRRYIYGKKRNTNGQSK
jgi:hypothetical protein